MNIFYLDNDPRAAAQAHCDKHVVKMILETAQMLSTAHHVIAGPKAPADAYKATHQNHPSAVWCRSSFETYMWTAHLGVELLIEYRHRYHKRHACTDKLCGSLLKPPRGIELLDWEEPPFCGPETYRGMSVVDSYRRYYIGDKARFAKWTRRDAPVWWTPGSMQTHAGLSGSPPF